MYTYKNRLIEAIVMSKLNMLLYCPCLEHKLTNLLKEKKRTRKETKIKSRRTTKKKEKKSHQHHENLYNFDRLKPHFHIVKLGFKGYTLFFLFLLKNINCGYSLEPPRRGGTNEYMYPQFMFLAEI